MIFFGVIGVAAFRIGTAMCYRVACSGSHQHGPHRAVGGLHYFIRPW
jgi:hypothetical protein